MTFQTQLALVLFGAGLASTASAQNTIGAFYGPSPNIAAPAIDFDTPLVASGPAGAGLFAGTGITSITVVGAGWQSLGDTIGGASNMMGQGLVVANSVLTVGGFSEPLDTPSAGDGFDILLDSPVDEFELTFIDELGFTYDVELFNGATSIATANLVYGSSFPAPAVYYRVCDVAGSPLQYDRIVITFANAGGVGIDSLGFSNGSGPCMPAGPPPPPTNCVETGFLSGNGGNVGGAVYFDMTTAQAVTISGMLTNTSSTAPIGLEVYMVAGSYVGNEGNAAAWTLIAADDGNAIGQGNNQMTSVDFSAPMILPAGTFGIAIIGDNALTALNMDHDLHDRQRSEPEDHQRQRCVVSVPRRRG